LRIALIYDRVYPWIKGGGEKTFHELALELRDRGHEVHLFGMHLWDGPPDILHDGLYYHALCPRLPFYTAAGRRSLWEAVRFAWGLFRRLPRYRPRDFDLFDLHAFPFFSVIAFRLVRALFARRLPWVVTWLEVWGPDYWKRYLGSLGRIGAGIERLCARLAPVHLCISPTTANRLHELLGVPRHRIHVIPRGFQAPRDFKPTQAKNPHKAVVAGRLLDYKRVDLLVRAWPLVLKELPDARLHVIGDGPERAGLERLAAAEGVAAAVRFLGEVPNWEQVLDEIASAGLLLQPSVREGQSMVVLEAMGLGTAVLAADGPETAVGDFVGQGEDAPGLLLPVDAGPDVWARNIAQLLGDPGRLDRLARGGRRKLADLDWRHSIAPRVEALYRSLNGRTSAPGGGKLVLENRSG
jgi:glycosyltransferase involved in cell wall biosynthesis